MTRDHGRPVVVLVLLDALVERARLLHVVSLRLLVHCGNVLRLSRLALNVEKVDLVEEAMRLDVVRPVLQVAVALGQVVVSQVSDDALGSRVEALGEPDLLVEYLFEDLHGVIVHVGAAANHHFIDEDAQAVPVDSSTMALVQDNLGRKVLRSAA